MQRLWLLAAAALSSTVLVSTAWAGEVPPTPVPEPASLALLASGVAGVAWTKFRRRK